MCVLESHCFLYAWKHFNEISLEKLSFFHIISAEENSILCQTNQPGKKATHFFLFRRYIFLRFYLSLSVWFGWFTDLGRKQKEELPVKLWSFRSRFTWSTIDICHFANIQCSFVQVCRLEGYARQSWNSNECSLCATPLLTNVLKLLKSLELSFCSSIETRKSITEHKAKLVHTNNSIFSISLLCVGWLACSLALFQCVLCFFLCLLSVSSVCDECRWERILSCVLNITDDNVISNAVLCHSRSRYTPLSLSQSLNLDYTVHMLS